MRRLVFKPAHPHFFEYYFSHKFFFIKSMKYKNSEIIKEILLATNINRVWLDRNLQSNVIMIHPSLQYKYCFVLNLKSHGDQVL